MPKSLFTILLLLSLPYFTIAQFADCDPDNPPLRYQSRNFFNSNQLIQDVVYSDNGSTQFAMDIYLPPNSDTETSRPLVMWAHPGAFLNGSKDTDTAILWCETLAKMGFVCASIDYRKDVFTDALFGRPERAPYKGIQDARSAIRYMKANAATYGININDVYFAGESAGGIISINVAYMENAERPSDTFGGFFFSDLGCVDCGANALVNNSTFNGDIDGSIMLWGAVNDVNVIDGITGTQTDDEPCLLLHGDLDETVSPGVGPPFGADLLFPDTYGTYPMRERLNSLGSNAPDWEAHVLCLEGHGFWVDKTQSDAGNGDFGSSGIPDENFDYIVNESIDFLARTRGINLTISDDISHSVTTSTALDECDNESVGTYANSAFNEYFVVNPTIGNTYCWDITKGTILEGLGTDRIKVRWDDTPGIAVNRTGTVLCYEADTNGNIFEASLHLVSIQDGSDTAPDASFTVNSGSSNEEFDFTNTSMNEINYFWDFGDGTTSTLENPTHIYTASGDYDVILQVTNSNGAISENTQTVQVISNSVEVAIKVFLQGNYETATQLMVDTLNQIGQIPSTNPLTDNDLENLGASVDSGVLQVTGNDAIVDWVRVELRSDASTLVQAKAALLQRDGDVVDLDGVSAVGFAGVSAGTYHVVVKHRNHLGVMSLPIMVE